MKRILTFLLCCLLLSGCTQQNPTPTAPPTAPPATDTPTTAPTFIETEAPTVAPTEAVLLPITVYYGDDNAEAFLSREVMVPEINTITLVRELIAVGVMPEGIAVNDLTADGTQLNVDFNSAFYDYLCTMGTSGERILVGSVVNTFISAYQVESVYITVDGQIIESGHVIYDFPLEFME